MKKNPTLWLFIILICACRDKERLATAEPLYEKGLELDRAGSYSGAVDKYREAIKIFPDYRDAHFQLASVYEKLALIDQALLEYKRVIDIDDDFAPAFNNLGNVYGKKGFLDSALMAYQKATSRDNELPSAYYNLGQTYVLKKDFLEAEKGFKRALELSPSDPEYLHAFGLLKLTERRYDEAISFYRRALQQRNVPIWRFELSAAYRAMGHLDEAIFELEKYAESLSDVQEKNIVQNQIRELKMEKIQKKLAQSRNKP